MISVTVPLLLAACPISAERFELSRNGQARCDIVVATDALPITLRAAEDLREHLGKVTGGTFALRRADAIDEGEAIIVGDHPAARAAGIDPADLKPEGFRILTRPGHLFIVGRDTPGKADSLHWINAPQAGTWNGVSDFLQTDLGVRWFYPGPDGADLPNRPSLSLGPIDRTGSPGMAYRRMLYLLDSGAPPKRRREVIDWARRNRAGWSVIWDASHSWREHFRAEDYFQDHPEWFALVDGRRMGTSTHGAQMCTTNPQALDRLAETALAFSRKNPRVMFPLTPNDGGGHCECPACRALDVETLSSGQPSLTDRYVTYCNEIARRVVNHRPDQMFGLYAYIYYALPPRRTKLHPSVKVMGVLNDIDLKYQLPEIRRRHLEDFLQPWKQAVGDLYFYTHPQGNSNLSLPAYTFDAIAALFANLRRASVTGFSMNVRDSFAATGLNNYLLLQLAWNPNQDADALYEDALRRCYGPAAAAPVREVFGIVEGRLRQHARKHITFQRHPLGWVDRFPGIFRAYEGLADEIRPLLEQALARADTPGRKARVEMLLKHLEYVEMTLALYQAGRELLDESQPKPVRVAEALDLARKRSAWMDRNDHTNQIFAGRVRRQEKKNSLPLTVSFYQGQLRRARIGQVAADVEAASRPPTIDGRLDDRCWKQTVELPVNLAKDNGAKVDHGAFAKLAWDAQYLYVAVECSEPLMNKLNDTVRKHDGPVWQDNEIELFLDVGATRREFYQLCVNSLGTVFDQRQTGEQSDASWNSDARVATQRGKVGWTVEMAIPLSSLTDRPVRRGDVWGLNLCRVRAVTQPKQYACWSPTFGSFKQPSRFGKIVFRQGVSPPQPNRRESAP